MTNIFQQMIPFGEICSRFWPRGALHGGTSYAEYWRLILMMFIVLVVMDVVISDFGLVWDWSWYGTWG